MRLTALLAAISAFVPFAAFAQSAPDAKPQAEATPTPTSSGTPYADRLEALRPENPRAYFEFAEELAETKSSNPENARLARTLCVLSFELWRNGRVKTSDPRLGPSSLLLLATIADSAEQAQWLRMVAAAIDPEALTETGHAVEIVRQPVTDTAVLDLVSAMELLRAGEGRRAAKLFEKPEVAQLLAANDRLLSPSGITGEGDRLKRAAADWPICPECRNRRSVRSANGISLCPTCGGDPGPPFSPIEVLFQLRLEAALLEGVQRSWVAQTLVDGGRPLRDLDPQEVALTFGVDPAKTIWRGGEWRDPKPPTPIVPTAKPGSSEKQPIKPTGPSGGQTTPAPAEMKQPASSPSAPQATP